MQELELVAQRQAAVDRPRNMAAVKTHMLEVATLDRETAEACFYALPRGGKTIFGPSVRLAEIALASFGNSRCGCRIINVDTKSENPHVIVQAVAMDLENNVAISIEKRRRIVKKRGRAEIDDDDVNLATNAAIAIAFRDAVFKIIPGAIIKPVMEAAKKLAIGDSKSLENRRARAIEAFAKMGVSADRILAVLGKDSVDKIDFEDIQMLLGLHNAIRDGATTIDEAFPVKEKSAVQEPKPLKTAKLAYVPQLSIVQPPTHEVAPAAAAKAVPDEKTDDPADKFNELKAKKPVLLRRALKRRGISEIADPGDLQPAVVEDIIREVEK